MGRLGTASPTRLLGPRWLQTLHLYTLHVGAAALLLLMFSASKQRHHQKPILPTFLSAMVHRRVAAAYTDWLIAANGIASHHAASRSGIRLLLLLILAGAANGRFPLLLRPRRALEEHPDCAGPSPEGWPIAFQTLRIDLEGAHPWRASPPKVLLFLAKGQAPENRCDSRPILLLQLLSLSSHHSTSPEGRVPRQRLRCLEKSTWNP